MIKRIIEIITLNVAHGIETEVSLTFLAFVVRSRFEGPVQHLVDDLTANILTLQVEAPLLLTNLVELPGTFQLHILAQSSFDLSTQQVMEYSRVTN